MSSRLSWILALSVIDAHPMGNSSVNHYSRLELSPDRLDIHYVLDLAEIPSLELMRQWNLTPHAVLPEIDNHTERQAREWTGNLRIENNGHPVTPAFEDARLTLADGDGEMSVLRFDMRVSAQVQPGSLVYRDLNFPGRAGWKEIVAAPATGVRLVRSNVTTVERSKALTSYPKDISIAPPQVTEIALEWTPDSPAVSGGSMSDVPGGKGFISWTVMWLAILTAVGLGAAHAFRRPR